MNEKFVNDSGNITIDDKGITCHLYYIGTVGQSDSQSQDIFYPYGCMTELKLGFWGLTIKAGNHFSMYTTVGDQKKKLKQLLPTLQSLNAKAAKCEPVIIDMLVEKEEKIEKSVESISSYFGGFDSKYADVWTKGIATQINSMEADEEIIYGFKGNAIHINGDQESVAHYIGLITNKRFYYAGCEGNAILTYSKTGTVELKDIHAITLGDHTFDSNQYVEFKVNNDNYKILTFGNVSLIKDKLEAGIKACKDTQKTSTFVQAGFSAADELKKFKELLDMGIITQEEFDAKKKQLLGL